MNLFYKAKTVESGSSKLQSRKVSARTHKEPLKLHEKKKRKRCQNRKKAVWIWQITPKSWLELLLQARPTVLVCQHQKFKIGNLCSDLILIIWITSCLGRVGHLLYYNQTETKSCVRKVCLETKIFTIGQRNLYMCTKMKKNDLELRSDYISESGGIPVRQPNDEFILQHNNVNNRKCERFI